MTARIMTIYGTRPEAIKVAPVIRALEGSGKLDSVTLVTGQHREMLDQVNDFFGITPDHDLDVFAQGQSLNELMGKMFTRLDRVLADDRPDAVLVQGDTSTVVAAAQAAFHQDIKVIHLEAGLRSGDLFSPFPEEANRRLVSQLASLHLAATSTARMNLLREGTSEATIAVTGNTVIDALLQAVRAEAPFEDERIADAVAQGRPIVLVTTHRRENWGSAMEGVGRALRRIALENPEWMIVLPAHRNPLVREAVLPQVTDVANVIISEPLPYDQFTHLLSACRIVLTDSGGVQEEAPSLGKPVLVMRENTERPEAVVAGTVQLIGTDEQRIVDEVSRLIHDQRWYDAIANAVNPYGDGRAADRTVAAIEHLFGLGDRLPDFGTDETGTAAAPVDEEVAEALSPTDLASLTAIPAGAK
ncbi:UDP-N-acetylglucosamine 2-epimerase (non-hydrolyzing) [Naumannella cuiyingiana]|uniref:UDP-N-acetylglucosamine 2-epimerase (non-hydrolyzing) n=1 Tax=Naumannella cuiyingiana TaxID=1347891 RepID=A0A7Z0D9U8_9ACTN|nr:UDP-N-acetylglucosamine 2-epimerase (non-hydrolyzing) [Naumannella cuiyingiana]NYI71457.1 UDP-N-acetylglucosamine 2-epimerase (non-hydrolyzing) [Naumannella cuiyingiana]